MTLNFTLAELTVTNTGLANTPNADQLVNIERLAATLERVRRALGGKALIVTSAFRSPAVNRAVGGSPTSAHVHGLAADFTCPRYGSPLQVCMAIEESGIEFDQLIHEYDRWVHLGIGPRERGEVLTIDKRGARPGLWEARR